jgi:hypothetical protein
MIDRREERDVIRYAQQESQRAAKPFKRSVKISERFSGLPLFRGTIAQSAFFRSLKGKGAKDTHLSLAPLLTLPRRSSVSVSVTEPFAPSRSATLTFQGVVRVVRSLCGEVTNSDALASCVTERPHEAVSNFRDLLCVKLAYHSRHENAFQQDFERHVEPVGPLPQECPVFRFKVARSQVYDGVRRFAVSARDSIVRHGRFLFLNGKGFGCVRAGECSSTCQPALFGGCGPL